jgi:hypothetical protein
MSASKSETQAWSIVRSRIKRFYDEGMTVWTLENFLKEFHNEKAVAESDYVKARLFDLVFEGKISLRPDPGVFFVVHNI